MSLIKWSEQEFNMVADAIYGADKKTIEEHDAKPRILYTWNGRRFITLWDNELGRDFYVVLYRKFEGKETKVDDRLVIYKTSRTREELEASDSDRDWRDKIGRTFTKVYFGELTPVYDAHEVEGEIKVSIVYEGKEVFMTSNDPDLLAKFTNKVLLGCD